MVLSVPRRVWIAGFPSSYGGADTELDHQIDLLRCNDVEVHLVPMFSPTAEMHEDAARRGCVVHEYRDDIFEDRVVLSWCNGAFLERLPEIMFAGRPRRIVWFNCMTWLFDREREAHDRGWIDLFGSMPVVRRAPGPRNRESLAAVATPDGEFVVGVVVEATDQCPLGAGRHGEFASPGALGPCLGRVAVVAGQPARERWLEPPVGAAELATASKQHRVARLQIHPCDHRQHRIAVEDQGHRLDRSARAVVREVTPGDDVREVFIGGVVGAIHPRTGAVGRETQRPP